MKIEELQELKEKVEQLIKKRNEVLEIQEEIKKLEETDEIKEECLKRVAKLTEKVTMYSNIKYI